MYIHVDIHVLFDLNLNLKGWNFKFHVRNPSVEGK